MWSSSYWCWYVFCPLFSLSFEHLPLVPFPLYRLIMWPWSQLGGMCSSWCILFMVIRMFFLVLSSTSMKISFGMQSGPRLFSVLFFYYILEIFVRDFFSVLFSSSRSCNFLFDWMLWISMVFLWSTGRMLACLVLLYIVLQRSLLYVFLFLVGQWLFCRPLWWCCIPIHFSVWPSFSFPILYWVVVLPFCCYVFQFFYCFHFYFFQGSTVVVLGF